MTVKELRERLPWSDDDAEVQIILSGEYHVEFGGLSLEKVLLITDNDPECKSTRVVLVTE